MPATPTKIEISLSRSPETACTFEINPYMPTPRGEKAHPAVTTVDAATTLVATMKSRRVTIMP